MIRISLFIILFFLFGRTFAIDADSTYRKDSSTTQNEIAPLRILSWNIFLLPAYIFETEYKYKRALGIAEEIKKLNCQIIVFQEAFHKVARATIARELRELFPYQYGPSNNKSFTRFNSGIWIISKIPLYNPDEIKYTRRSGIDAMANKGALLMEGCWGGHKFQVVGTHLQSSGSYDIRKDQLGQLYENLLKPNEKKDVPQFICGDMNICYKNCIEYEEMLKILDAEGEVNINDEEATNLDGDRIDYIFVRKNGAPEFEINRSVYILTHKCTKNRNFLSDHYAVGASIQFKDKKECGTPVIN